MHKTRPSVQKGQHETAAKSSRAAKSRATKACKLVSLCAPESQQAETRELRPDNRITIDAESPRLRSWLKLTVTAVLSEYCKSSSKNNRVRTTMRDDEDCHY